MSAAVDVSLLASAIPSLVKYQSSTYSMRLTLSSANFNGEGRTLSSMQALGSNSVKVVFSRERGSVSTSSSCDSCLGGGGGGVGGRGGGVTDLWRPFCWFHICCIMPMAPSSEQLKRVCIAFIVAENSSESQAGGGGTSSISFLYSRTLGVSQRERI